MDNCIYGGLTLVSLFNHQSEKSVQTEASFLETYIVKDLFDSMNKQNFVKYECFDKPSAKEPHTIRVDKPNAEEYSSTKSDPNNFELSFFEEQFKVHLSHLKPFEQNACSNDISAMEGDIERKAIMIKHEKAKACSSSTRHSKVSNAEKRFKCDTCSKRFLNSSDYKRHLKIHTDEKLFICEVCNKGRQNLCFVLCACL